MIVALGMRRFVIQWGIAVLMVASAGAGGAQGAGGSPAKPISVLAVHPSLPVKSVKELIAFRKLVREAGIQAN